MCPLTSKIKIMNFNPNKIKIVISVIVGILITLIMPYIMWIVNSCQSMGCIAVVPKCNLINPYQCCAECITVGELLIQKSTAFLIGFILTYILYSFLSKKS